MKDDWRYERYLKKIFELFARIVADGFFDLHLSTSKINGVTCIRWYVGDVVNPSHGSLYDVLWCDEDFDEDKACGWIDTFTELAYPTEEEVVFDKWDNEEDEKMQEYMAERNG